MGYAFCLGECCCCGKRFTFNPVRVPSLRVKGEREPVCEDCIREANHIRVEKGLTPLEYSKDAYSFCSEGELLQ